MIPYTILIVEDEVIPANYLKKQLEQAKHKVLAITKDMDSTLEYFSNNSEKINLVLMDVKIKGKVDGIALAKEIQKISYATAILFTTAYTDNDFLQRAKEVNSIGYLVKPIQKNTLLSTIEINMSHFQPQNTKQIYYLCDNTYFNEIEQTIISNNNSIVLSQPEFLILKTFLKNKHQCTSIKEIASILENITPLKNATLRTLIWRLRKKLPKCLIIENIYNLGYKIKIL